MDGQDVAGGPLFWSEPGTVAGVGREPGGNLGFCLYLISRGEGPARCIPRVNFQTFPELQEGPGCSMVMA